jgi:hypothetical protein
MVGLVVRDGMCGDPHPNAFPLACENTFAPAFSI